jgi:hypothetical protein
VKLNNLSKKQLYERAKELGIKGRGRMTKSQLVSAIANFYKADELLQRSAPVDGIHFYQVGYETKDVSEKKEFVAPETKQQEYVIPEKYGFDYVYVLPINPISVHIFWEVTEQSLKNFSYEFGIKEPKLCIKLIYDGGEYIIKDVADFGSYYFSSEFIVNKKVWAEIGVLNEDEFYAIAVSNETIIPSDTISVEEGELFMLVKDNITKIINISLGGDAKGLDSNLIAKGLLNNVISSKKFRGEK